jgi:phosphatidylinositol-bisphosphatase
LESGKDIFITIAGDFERSVFGCSIQALVNMSEPLKSISAGKLIELVSIIGNTDSLPFRVCGNMDYLWMFPSKLQEKGKLPLNHYDVPKELWFLVDRLYKTGMEKENLFTQSGLQSEILEIRDWLDNIPNTPMRMESTFSNHR